MHTPAAGSLGIQRHNRNPLGRMTTPPGGFFTSRWCALNALHRSPKTASNKSWATRVMMTSVAEDGKTREMFMVDRRTLIQKAGLY